MGLFDALKQEAMVAVKKFAGDHRSSGRKP